MFDLIQRYTRLTRRGQLFALMGVLSILPAWNTGNNLLYLLAGGFYSVLLVSYVLSSITIKELRVQRDAPHAVHRHQPFASTIQIENPKRIFPACSLRVEYEGLPGVAQGFAIYVPARTVTSIRITETQPRRGVFTLPPIRMVSAFPFGLVQARKTFPERREVVVYPRVTTLRAVTMESHSGSGDASLTTRADGSEYFSLREYVAGDDIRRISWRASARLGTLIIKEMEQESLRFVTVAFDARYDASLDVEADSRPPNADDLFEQSVELAASMALSLLNRQFSVAVISNNGFLSEGEGYSHRLKILDFFARVEPVPRDKEDLFRSLAPSDTAHTAYVCVSADPGRWGKSVGIGRVLNPSEVIRA